MTDVQTAVRTDGPGDDVQPTDLAKTATFVVTVRALTAHIDPPSSGLPVTSRAQTSGSVLQNSRRSSGHNTIVDAAVGPAHDHYL